jgi:phage host-nuclease inhibitor protein Gam
MEITITEMSLEDFLTSEATPEGFAFGEAFTINNDDEALWAMRSLAKAQRRIDEVKRQAQIELDRINRWVEANVVGNTQTVEYFDRILGDYLMRVRENDADGRKSLSFPDGTVTSRVTQPKVEVTDLEAFLTWAESNGHAEWVRVKREANLAEIKKGVDFEESAVLDPITGLPIDGLAPVAGGISTSTKVAE